MSEKKKLVGVYLPLSLVAQLKAYISRLYLERGIQISQSGVIEEAIRKHLADQKK